MCVRLSGSRSHGRATLRYRNGPFGAQYGCSSSGRLDAGLKSHPSPEESRGASPCTKLKRYRNCPTATLNSSNPVKSIAMRSLSPLIRADLSRARGGEAVHGRSPPKTANVPKARDSHPLASGAFLLCGDDGTRAMTSGRRASSSTEIHGPRECQVHFESRKGSPPQCRSDHRHPPECESIKIAHRVISCATDAQYVICGTYVFYVFGSYQRLLFIVPVSLVGEGPLHRRTGE